MAVTYNMASGDRRMRAPPVAERLLAQRAGDEEALRVVAAKPLQLVEDRRGLDALGRGGDLEVVREVDRGAHERPVAAVAQESRDIRAIDLDLVHRQLPQLR